MVSMSMLCPIIGLALIAVAAWLAVSGLKLRALARDPLPACSHCGHLIEGSRLLCTECGTQWTQEHLSRLALARRNSGTKRLVIALS
ncbi:MAG: hypothetical protein EXS03_05905, partial [Phycisphaerales bacterium]|nr:hypothetical protein [Phycisphaerales bacterium]